MSNQSIKELSANPAFIQEYLRRYGDKCIKMNEMSGQLLYECFRNSTNFMKTGIDDLDAMEMIGIPFDIMGQYFKGRRDLPQKHLYQIAVACGIEWDVLSCKLNAACDKAVTEKQRIEAEELECRRQRAEAEQRKQRTEAIMRDLRKYGVESVSNDIGYTFDAYYPLKFIIHFLHDKAYLPKLAQLLQSCKDLDLVHGDGNALMWAAEYLSFDKLMMLADRNDFIAAHIQDRSPCGHSILHHIVDSLSSHEEIAKAIHLVAECGADVNALDHNLWTPLHYVAHNYERNKLLWDALLSCGADKTLKNKDGNTPDEVWRLAEERREALDAW